MNQGNCKNRPIEPKRSFALLLTRIRRLHEISQLRYSILEHLLRHVDQVPLQLTADGMSEQEDDEVGWKDRERIE